MLLSGKLVQVLVRPVHPPRYPADVLRLRHAMNDMGFDASDSDIEWAYEQISDELCCGWLILNSWDFDTTAARGVMKRLVPNAKPQATPTEDTNL